MIESFNGIEPVLGAGAWVHALAFVNGEVRLGKRVGVFPTAVIRGDCAPVVIGDDTNVQDGALLHTTHGSRFFAQQPLTIGARVTIGHGAILHGCTVGNEVLVGMGSTVLDGAVVEDRVLIGAGSLVPPGKRLESGFLYLGRPVQKVRPLTAEEIAFFNYSAENYVRLGRGYKT